MKCISVQDDGTAMRTTVKSGTANAVPLFTVVRIAVPLFKAGRTGAANVPPRMRDCSARAYSTYAWASTVKLILTKAIV